MRRSLSGALICLLFLLLLSIRVTKAGARAGQAWSLMGEAKSLRALDGRAPYEVNEAPVAAAPSRSAWQAETGSTGTPTKQRPTLVPQALSPQTGSSEASNPGPAPEVQTPEPGPDYLLILILLLAITGTALVGLGSALKRTG